MDKTQDNIVLTQKIGLVFTSNWGPDQIHSISGSKGEQREYFGEENVEVCYGHQVFKQPKEEKLKQKIFLNSMFKETEEHHNNTIIKHSS